MNEITPDGLLKVDHCERTIRYRDEEIILQDACTPEPRLVLVLRKTAPGVFPETRGACRTLDVVRATALHAALGAFLLSSRGQSGWQYGGVVYDLDKAWEGRPGTPYEGIWYRHNDRFIDVVPVMEAVDPVNGDVITLAEVLGLKPCPVHDIYSDPCHMCALADDPAQWA